MSINQLIMLGVAGLIVSGGALLHGKKTDRWGNMQSAKLVSYSDRMANIPTTVGNWTSKEMAVDEEQFAASNCHRAFSRVFTNASTEESVSVFLVSGRGYHCTIHTPDECYVAAGFNMKNEPAPYSFDVPGLEEECEVVHALFNKDTPELTERLRILWLYSVDGKTWKSPKYAKYTYGEENAMYKLYLIRNATDGAPKLSEDPTVIFARQFLPEISKVLSVESPAAVAEPAPAG